MRVSDPQTDVAPGRTRGRNVRSKNQCSMCPAIHTKSRSWLRSSSTREPSDPLLRVVIQIFGRGPRDCSLSRKCVRFCVRILSPSQGEDRSGGSTSRARGPPFRRDGASETPRKGPGNCRGGRTRCRALLIKPGATACQAEALPLAAVSAAGAQAPHRLPEMRSKVRNRKRNRTDGFERRQGPRAANSSEFALVDDLRGRPTVMILPLVHQRKPCYDFYFL